MSRLKNTFERLHQESKQALIPYIMAGDPDLPQTLELMHQMVDAGANVIELGIPFSDPMADGAVIQLAAERALDAGTNLQTVLDMVAQFRQRDQQTAVVLMGYLNPVEWMGYETFAKAASTAGVDGMLLVDLPPEEAGDTQSLFQQYGLDLIFLLAPTTTDERIAQAAKLASGYLYYVSLKGVTGAATLDVTDVTCHLQRIRRYVSLPVCVGFGIKDAESAASVAAVADGVVVGSALVKHIAAGASKKSVALLKSMRVAMDK